MSEIFLNYCPEKNLKPELNYDSKSCVLVFSPEGDDLLLYKTVFGIWSYNVVEVNKINDLLITIELVKPKAILIDEQIDFEETLNVIKLIRRIPAFINIPLILISGYAQPHFREIALSNGVDEFFLKPVDFDKLEQSLKKFANLT